MRWDYLFNEQVLAQGKEYFQSGRVGELMHRGATYQAKVAGSKRYDVEAYLTDRVHPRLYCDCQEALDGHACKHMAAVLYAIAEEESQRSPQAKVTGKKKEKSGPKRIYPFSHRWTLLDDGETVSGDQSSAQDEYEYFDLKEMTKNFVFYEDSCQAALKMIKEGKLVLQEVRLGYPNKLGAN